MSTNSIGALSALLGSGSGYGTTDAGTTSGASSTGSTSATASSTPAGFSLSSDDYFKLFLTQLQNQDPTQPMDDSQMVGELSQFTMIETLKQVSAALDGTRLAQSAGLIGKQVTGYAESGDTLTGTVDRVDQTADGFWLIVNGQRMSADSVASVTNPTTTTTTSKTTGA